MHTIYMMVGISGSGKSTKAKELRPLLSDEYDVVIVSSDAIRKEMYGDESVQSNPHAIFACCYQRIEDALNDNYDVIFDATNLTPTDRANLINQFGERAEIVAFVFTTPLTQCILNQSKRERKVPEKVIRRQAAKFKFPTMDEGFTMIYPVRWGD